MNHKTHPAPSRFLLAASAAIVQSTIKDLAINSYKAQPAFLNRVKKGLGAGANEINKAGGVNGEARLVP